MSADAVALCMGISVSKQTLLISTGDLQNPKRNKKNTSTKLPIQIKESKQKFLVNQKSSTPRSRAYLKMRRGAAAGSLLGSGAGPARDAALAAAPRMDEEEATPDRRNDLAAAAAAAAAIASGRVRSAVALRRQRTGARR